MTGIDGEMGTHSVQGKASAQSEKREFRSFLC